ncbi:hypothetical protein V498_00789 [Pseudogymnoascus sp. VKM F-4517 (FW-2822)]|nr:hypothetical protein V498_00789 [Pseudogymnoascus sp. VKM F-4517 (FW-2822)]
MSAGLAETPEQFATANVHVVQDALGPIDHVSLSSHEELFFQELDPPIALSWLSINIGYEERDLLNHFICTASSTLAIFEPDKNEFLGLLMRLALLDSSPSSVAVLQSALALSSLHRHGLQADVLQFKARSLRSLIISCNNSIERPTVVQHIAASMILCHLEVRLGLDLYLLVEQTLTALKMLGMPSALPLWYCHLNEAKGLIESAGVDSEHFQGEFSTLINWVEYHFVMARFSLRHWHINAERIDGLRTSAPIEQGSCLLQKVKSASYCSHEILRHLYVTFEMIQKPTDALYHSEEYEKALRCLEKRITNSVLLAPEDISDTMSGLSTAWMVTMELFKIASLIYLKRASRNFSGTTPQIDAMVERAYVLLGDLETFDPAFPLLIIGCEARTDEQRMRMLEHIGRVMKASSLRDLLGLQDILQQIWVQDDLAVGYELDYLNKLDAVITSYRIMPSFV